jgi:putative nucleotidyltransferase with HDIG domain
MPGSEGTTLRPHLLVVDDERSVREVLAEALEAFGYSTRTASNSAEALEILQQGDTQLVLSDIDMPGGSGMDLLRRIKGRDQDVDVIMVTGVVEVDIAVRAIRDGAADYITKPFHIEEVRIIVERTLRNRALVLENRAYQTRLEEMVSQRTKELRDSYESILQALVTALDFRDNETQGHSSRVVQYAVLIAERLGLAETDVMWIKRGAILHDVGKIGVPDAVLRKPGKLDDREWAEMRRHPEMGYRMLQHIRFLEPALAIVLSHQERWDGSGYPQGLKGEDIPIGARIFAVVDTFDAMTSDRPYRKALTIAQARSEIGRCAGTQFDPAVADVFLSIEESVWHRIRDEVHEQIEQLERATRRLMG